jgi:phosphocarrier protein
MTRGQLTIMNPLGLHARPAAKLVDCAARYTSEIRLTHQGQTIDAKSIMSVLMLAAPCGAILEVSLDGNDEQAAMEALEALFSTGFGELE